MNHKEALSKLRDVMRRKHLSLSTERSYGGWLGRYCEYLAKYPSQQTSARKIEQFLTMLSRRDVSASTQNQAFNALVFFYREVLCQPLENIQALRAKRPATLRHAPEVAEVRGLIKCIERDADFATSLVVRLLYGCGLRVSEPLNLRFKDVQVDFGQLTIRAAKGGKDRVVPIPCSVVPDLQEQLESARAIWRRDAANGLPVPLPHRLAEKYPSHQFNLQWAWVFPARHPCRHPRTGQLVRWRLHETNIQRSIRRACEKLGFSILPHELRHAYATHTLSAGCNPRALQQAMGHKSLETTMGYLHAEAMSVRSPLDHA